MKNVSVIARDAKREGAIAGVDVKSEVTNQSGKGGAVGAVTGGVLGGVTGLLIGLGTLTIPGLGPALLAGEAATVLATLAGGAAGAVAGGIVGALVGLGIPEHRAQHYQDRVASGDYLVMLKDTEPEIARAEKTLRAAGVEDWGVYKLPRDASRSESLTAKAGVNDRRQTATLAARGNEFNRVDHPADQDYPHHDRTTSNGAIHAAGLPHDSNPVATIPDDFASAGEDEQRLIGIFRDRQQLETALGQLRQTGFPVHTLSIAVRETHPQALKQQDSEGHALVGATALASRLKLLELPEIGALSVMGPDADAIDREIAHHPSRSIASILESLGIAQEAANLYSRYLADGAYLITLRGHNQGLGQTAAALGRHGMHDWGIYDVQRAQS